MPAAKRYKQSKIDSLREAIRKLPPGEPPEPELTKPEALALMAADFRAKMNAEHVEIESIVKLLNAEGFKVSAADVKKAAKAAADKQLPRVRKVGPAKKPRASGSDPERKEDAGPRSPKGGFVVQPDGDDI